MERQMANNKLQGYALFVDNVFRTVIYYPSEGSWQAVRVTAALKSNPTIVLDESNTVESVNKYSILVDGEYADYLFIPKHNDAFDLSTLHNALQSSPTVIWIDSETLPHPDTKWSYENNILTQVED
jgi:hypothetical protein